MLLRAGVSTGASLSGSKLVILTCFDVSSVQLIGLDNLREKTLHLLYYARTSFLPLTISY